MKHSHGALHAVMGALLMVAAWPAQAGNDGDWALSGNAGTTAGVNFVGTTDNTALEGDVEPDLILTVPDAEALACLVVGSDGTGYISDANRNAVYVYHDIANRDGEVAPDGTIQGARTGLSGPGDLALYEPQE